MEQYGLIIIRPLASNLKCPFQDYCLYSFAGCIDMVVLELDHVAHSSTILLFSFWLGGKTDGKGGVDDGDSLSAAIS